MCKTKANLRLKVSLFTYDQLCCCSILQLNNGKLNQIDDFSFSYLYAFVFNVLEL